MKVSSLEEKVHRVVFIDIFSWNSSVPDNLLSQYVLPTLMLKSTTTVQKILKTRDSDIQQQSSLTNKLPKLLFADCAGKCCYHNHGRGQRYKYSS